MRSVDSAMERASAAPVGIQARRAFWNLQNVGILAVPEILDFLLTEGNLRGSGRLGGNSKIAANRLLMPICHYFGGEKSMYFLDWKYMDFSLSVAFLLGIRSDVDLPIAKIGDREIGGFHTLFAYKV